MTMMYWKNVFLWMITMVNILQGDELDRTTIMPDERELEQKFNFAIQENIKEVNKNESKIVRRMVGGQRVSIESFPWTAMVISRGRCGGALIHVQWVLTAAHCISSPNPVVYFGIDHQTSASVFNKRNVIQVHKPPRSMLTTGDLALLKLDSPVPLSPYSMPIRLNDERKAVLRRIGTVAGFGRNHLASDQLMAGEFRIEPVLLLSQTRDIIGGRSPSQSPCYGDSGSGLIVEYDGEPILAGITSSILSHSCSPNHLALYTDVAYYYQWIIDKMGFVPQRKQNEENGTNQGYKEPSNPPVIVPATPPSSRNQCWPIPLPWNMKIMFCSSWLEQLYPRLYNHQNNRNSRLLPYNKTKSSSTRPSLFKSKISTSE